MSKNEQKEVNVMVSLPDHGFRKSMYFNRFKVEREDEFLLVQMGLFTASGVIDSYTCIFTNEVRDRNKETNMDYLNRIGMPVEKNPLWKGTEIERQIDVVDVCAMAVRNNMAEICFYNFSLARATQSSSATKQNETVLAQPLALLRCSAETQKQLIVALYDTV